jgi:hypothetical protein
MSGISSYNGVYRSYKPIHLSIPTDLPPELPILPEATTTANATLKGACEPDKSWDLYVKMICIPVFCILGLIGNTLSFIVMFNKSYRRKSYSYYLRGLAIFDNLTLIIETVLTADELTREMCMERVLGAHNDMTCKLTELLRHVVYLMSSWLIVCFTLDRYIAVCHPLWRLKLNSERRALVNMVVIFFLAAASQVFRLFYIKSVDRDGYMCHAPVEQVPQRPLGGSISGVTYNNQTVLTLNTTISNVNNTEIRDIKARLDYYAWHYFWFSFVCRFFLPFCVIAVCNGLIIFHIKRIRESRRYKERDRSRNANMAIYTLYVVCACFVITLLPNAIISITMFIVYANFGRSIRTQTIYKALEPLDTPFHIIRLANYSINFVLYGLTGRQFRAEVKRLFTGRLDECACSQPVGWISLLCSSKSRDMRDDAPVYLGTATVNFNGAVKLRDTGNRWQHRHVHI